MDFEASALAYIRHVMAEQKLSPTGLAKKAGLSSSTLTRALNDPNHKFTLSMKTLERIAEVSGISPAPFLAATSSIEMATLPFYNDKLYIDKEEPPPTVVWPQTVIYVGGEIGIGRWRQLGVFDPIKGYAPIPLTYPEFPPQDVFACVVCDESASLIAKPGDRLICVRPLAYLDLGMDVPSDWPVIVEMRSERDFSVELTVRILRAGRGAWRTLAAANVGKPMLEPIKYQSAETEPTPADRRWRIVGIVEFILRTPWER